MSSKMWSVFSGVVAVAFMTLVLASQGCGSSTSSGGTGGSTGTGGTSATGGSTGTGGTSATGGSTGTRGTSATGGAGGAAAADCSACDNEPACCIAIATAEGISTTNCSGYTAAMCN